VEVSTIDLRQAGDQVAATHLGVQLAVVCRRADGQLISSAVRSPSRIEYSFFAYWITALSSSSPATRTELAVTMPA